jgi:hypothetical protein
MLDAWRRRSRALVLLARPRDAVHPQHIFGKLMAEETEKWGKVIRAANIKVE